MTSKCQFNELISKSNEIQSLRCEIGRYQSKYSKLKNRLVEIEAEHTRFLDECKQIKLNSKPLQATIDSLTAERSKFLRKLKRLENK